MEIEWNSKVVELCKTAHYAMLDLVSMFCEEFEIDDMDRTGVFEYLLEHYKAESLNFGDGLYEYTVPHRFAHCIVDYNGRLS